MKSYRPSVFSNSPLIGALLGTLSLYFFEELFFQYRITFLLGIAWYFFGFSDKVAFYFSSLISFFMCFSFFWLMLRTTQKLQSIYFVLFLVAVAIQYGFWKAVQRFLLVVELNLATVTPMDIWTGAAILYFDWRFIFPVLFLLWLIRLFSNPLNLKMKTGLLYGTSWIFLVVSVNFGYSYFAINPEQGTSFTSFYQTVARFAAETMFAPGRDQIAVSIETIPQNNIVLIIDESIRGDHLSINGYPRETVPYLSKIARETSFIHNWGLATAGATCSFQSNSLILTGVMPSKNSFNLVYKYPTLFQYAKMMNYKTYYLDAQTNTLWNGLTNQDIKYIDEWYMSKDIGSGIYIDFQAAEMIRKIVSESTGNFVVLNKRGVHFLYENSYPASESIWGPIPDDYKQQPGLVTNAYDNGVRFNVNTFFERLLPNLENAFENTIYIYTSDHGETLFEDGATTLHCSNTWQEATVPLIILGYLEDAGDTTYKASHANIFATILDLMDVPIEARPYLYAPSLLHVNSSQNEERYFYSGNLDLVIYPK